MRATRSRRAPPTTRRVLTTASPPGCAAPGPWLRSPCSNRRAGGGPPPPPPISRPISRLGSPSVGSMWQTGDARRSCRTAPRTPTPRSAGSLTRASSSAAPRRTATCESRSAPGRPRTSSSGSRRPPPETPGSLIEDPLGPRVDVDLPAPREAAQRHPTVGRELDRQRTRRADADQDRSPRDRGLLDELEREPAADAQQVISERHEPIEQCAADHLVHRVVAPDVLAGNQQCPVGREQPGRVHAPGSGERRLIEARR